MTHRSPLRVAWFVMPLAAVLMNPSARADEIPCPWTGARWGVVDPLRDPLHHPAGDRPAALWRQDSFLVDGKHHVRCSYSRVPQAGEGVRLDVELHQPKIAGTAASQHFCPPAVRIALKGPLPQHWSAATYSLPRQSRFVDAGGSEVRCGYWQQGPWPGGRPPFDLVRPVRTQYATLSAPPAPPPPGLPLTNAFAVTRASCQVFAPGVPVDCPTTVTARCTVQANGPGEAAVRFVHNAREEPVRRLVFDDSRDAAQIGAEFVAPAPGPGPGSTGGLVTPSHAGEFDGSVRLRVLAPQAGIDSSNVATYSIACKQPRTPGGLGLTRRDTGPSPASQALGHERSSNEEFIELVAFQSAGPSVRAKVLSGDLLARIGGRARGPGQVYLEGSQALVFFLGGIPARSEVIPEIRGRTAQGTTFVLERVRVQSLATVAGEVRGHLLYQDLVIP